MLSKINQRIDGVTMYRVVLYTLTFFVIEAFVFSFLSFLHYSLLALFSSLLIISSAGILSHFLFKKIYNAPANIESSYITILLGFLILAPVTTIESGLWNAVAIFIAIASKYVIARGHRHIFNPLAFGVFIIGVLGATQVTWWVSSMFFLPGAIIAAYIVLSKIKRGHLFFSYIISSVVAVMLFAFLKNREMVGVVVQQFLSWPLLFLGIYMLTEPLTTPPTKKTQMIYGSIVGVLSSIPFAFPPIYSTPELALLIGNLFAYTVSTKDRYFLTFKEKKEIAKDTYEFSFSPSHSIPFISGQYMEWTLLHNQVDLRGVRRYFTIASSPFDNIIKLSIKKADNGSSFKQALLALEEGKGLLATSVSGDFVMPHNVDTPLVFIAGGIGITPFISMFRTLLQKGERRDIVLFYLNKKEEDVAYKDILDEVSNKFAVKVVYVLSDMEAVSPSWEGEKGFLTEEMVKKYVLHYTQSEYYISGPPLMVGAFSSMLRKGSVRSSQILTDFFPGLA